MGLKTEKTVSRRDLAGFFRFPARVYRNDPYWVRPLDRDMSARFDPRQNPFFEHSEVQPFLAFRDGRPVGRVAAILNHRHNDVHAEKAAWFGFFECLEDDEAGASLFSAVEDWAREKGAGFLRGPANFCSNDDWGLLVSGFDSAPMLRMPYNPPYYAALIEQAEFRKEKDLLAYHLDAQREIPERLRRVADLVSERTKVVIRPLRMDRFDEEIRLIQEIGNRAWERQWGFVPMTENEVVHFTDWLRPFCVPELALIAEIKSKPVGFALTLPDYNQLLKPMAGHWGPFGPLRLRFGRDRISAGRIAMAGLTREYRNQGIEALLYLRMWENGRRMGFLDGELSWILEDDAAMRNAIEKVGGTVYKTYRVYRKGL
jgi:GNAT superfamily N-acetyltransferase